MATLRYYPTPPPGYRPVEDGEWVVWGRRADYAGGEWIKLHAGGLRTCRDECAWRDSQGGWELTVRSPGEHPTDSASSLQRC